MGKGKQSSEIVIDCLGPYVPREHQAALEIGAKIRERGKKKGETKLNRPRLKHRPDVRDYIAEGGDVDGIIVNPIYVNPCKAQKCSGKAVVEVFWNAFPPGMLSDIVGRYNASPIYEFMGLEQYASTNCAFRGKCKFGKEGCKCVLRPYQLIEWGRMKDGVFVPLGEEETFSTDWMTIYQLRDKVREYIGEKKWQEFRTNKKNKKYAAIIDSCKNDMELEAAYDLVGALKIGDNIQTFQRFDTHTANCFGLAFAQFRLTIDSCFANDGETMMYRMTLNKMTPDRELKRTKKVKELALQAV